MPATSLKTKPNITRYLVIASLFWTACVVLAGMLVAISAHHLHVEHTAIRLAKTLMDRDRDIRLWASRHGGVYVPPSAQTPPNPYLTDIPNRDLTLADGRRLTLMNPAYILRELHEEFRLTWGIRSHLTSLQPIRPENSPAPWERHALESFAGGAQEHLDFTLTDGNKSLRYMQPLITEKSCLKCHARQGYKEGDIRGGISIVIPLERLLSEAREQKIAWMAALSALWLLGLAGIWLSSRRIVVTLKARDDAYAELASYQDELETTIQERTRSVQEANSQLAQEVRERIKAQNALEQSHDRLQQIFNSAADGLRIVDWDYNIVQFNDTFATMAGGSSQDLSGRKCYDVFSGPFCHTDKCPLAKARNGEEIIQEASKTNIDGQTLECLTQSALFYDTEGQAMGILESYRDITPLKELESKLSAEASRNAQQAVELQQKNTDIIRQNVELEEALVELKITQSQMLQSEKMATVGQLAAGVAHEINNPTGFVTSNLSSLKKYVERISDFLALLQEAVPPEKKEEIASLRKKMKIDHISEDIHDLIAESLAGTEQIKKIVMSLKNFSRQDQEEYGPANINDCLESTLNVVWNELKYKVTVEKEYGDLPLTKCYAQQLNQVFMNLLVNGAQAIEAQGVITIKTWTEDNSILISISDTGSGMDEETKAHIFEPFFTSKGKDQGTGLGLSIAYDIITKKHHGHISVDSQPGEGSTFIIDIPVVGA